MENSERKKSFEELADEALDGVAGGKTVCVLDCVVCSRSYDKIGPDGKAYCYTHYTERWPEG